jgi:serine phosphatase RsbU (regulator of sigma subunit)
LRTGAVVTVHDATEAVAAVLSGEAVEVLRELAPRTAYAVPLRAHGRTVGAMTLFLDADRPELAPDDVALVVQLADRAGLALDNDRLYEEQRSMAWSLQRALLSEPATPDRLEIALRYVPASKGAQVGGDWYDAFLQPRGGTVLVVGDVVGHDTHAAAEMSQIRTLVRGIGYTSSSGPRQILLDLDDAMLGLGLGTMATAMVARIEQPDPVADGGEDVTLLRWSSAGHPPPVVAAPDGTVELLRPAANGPLLGLGRRAERPEHATVLEHGSTLLLYSDGLVERRGEHLADGLDRLRRVVTALLDPRASQAPSSMQTFVDELLAAMVHERREDDVAIVAVRVGSESR